MAGMTLRWARSPVAPNRTTTAGSGTRSSCRPSRRTFSAGLARDGRLPICAMRRSFIVSGASLSFLGAAGVAGASGATGVAVFALDALVAFVVVAAVATFAAEAGLAAVAAAFELADLPA